MPKNILIFADGTGQAGGVRPDQQLSNIYKLYRATRVGPDSAIDPAQQVAFYDPGLGTRVENGRVRLSIWQTLKDVAGLAVGLGFSHNVIDCYEAILQRYEPGDRIFLFGFSRGGYTVRSVANVLNLCGVPTTDGEGKPLPRRGKRLRAIAREAVVRVYEHGAGHERKKFEFQRESLAREFRKKYGSGGHPARGDVFPAFIGVFDAVAALGLPAKARALAIMGGAVALALTSGVLTGLIGIWLEEWGWPIFWILMTAGAVATAAAYGRATLRFAPKASRGDGPAMHLAMWTSKNYDQYLDPRVPAVRHALAIDETRVQFGRVKWGQLSPHGSGERFRQRWFAGNHSDIGGSYPEEESRLSDIALSWMVGEAQALDHPLLIDPSKLQLYPDAVGPQHCEIFAQQQQSWWVRLIPWPSAPRKIHDDAELDPSVLARFQAPQIQACDSVGPYRPEALRMHKAVSHFY